MTAVIDHARTNLEQSRQLLVTLRSNLENGHAPSQNLTLGHLSERAVRDLVAEAVEAEPGAQLLGLVSAAAGNPLFVGELVAALIQDDALTHVGGKDDVDTAAAPPTLQITVLRRLSQLPESVITVLRSASILGRYFTVAELANVSESTVASLAPALADAVAAHVLEDDGTGLRFRHDLIHDAIYTDIPVSIRTALHRDAAHRLADANARPEVVAAQFLSSAVPGDLEAFEWLVQAARDLSRNFPDTGAELFSQALALVDSPISVRDELLVERADALVRAGRVPVAIDEFRGVLDRRHNPAVEHDIRLQLGSALTVAGMPSESLDQLAPISASGSATRAQLYASWAESGTAHLWRGELDHAEASTDPSGFAYPLHATRGFLLIELDRFDEARTALATGRSLCEKAGVRWPLPTYQAYTGIERYLRGEWDDAVSELQTSAELIDDTGVSFAEVLVHTTLALIDVHQGELGGATHAVQAAEEASNRGPQHFQHRIGWVKALVHEVRGEAVPAKSTLADAWDSCVATGTAVDYPLLGPDVVRLSLEAEERDVAERVTTVVEDVARESDVRSRRAAALRCRGLLQDDPAVLVEAAGLYTVAGRVLDGALTNEHAAVSLARRGDAALARRHFDEARRVFERLHANNDLLRLDSHLRAAGMPRGDRGPRHRPVSGWASLTKTERAVANLVAEGLTNPQIGSRLFVSRRTVQTHVSHIFAKLDLTSRTQLATTVARNRGTQH